LKLRIKIVHSATLVIMRSLPISSSCTEWQLAGIYELNIHAPLIEEWYEHSNRSRAQIDIQNENLASGFGRRKPNKRSKKKLHADDYFIGQIMYM
jgi:hypothetical protein